MTALGTVELHLGDNLPILRDLPSQTFDLIYIDPPFNTGQVQHHTRVRTEQQPGEAVEGSREGFRGASYRTIQLGSHSFHDHFDDYLAFLEPRLAEAHRLLQPDGSLIVHLDFREVHYVKVLLDSLFGRKCFLNELIWAYDYGGRSKKRWSPKHDNLLWYAKDPRKYTFNFEEMDRIPYMAPGLVKPEKRARGKTPTDVWWHTIVPTAGPERTGYPTQKPLGVLRRLLSVHSRPGDRVLDFFAGSGTTGEVAARLGRDVVLIDENPDALNIMEERLAFASPRVYR